MLIAACIAVGCLATARCSKDFSGPGQLSALLLYSYTSVVEQGNLL